MLIFFGLVALLVARLNQREATEPLVGKAYVIDGDTISILRDHIRLKGIDAPELAQTCDGASKAYPCGQISRQSLIKLIGGRQVRCVDEGRDKFNRTLATCFTGDINLNRSMIEAGQAAAYGDYRDVELQARLKRVGLWAGKFETPQDWRRDHEQPNETVQPQQNQAPNLFDRLMEWVIGILGGIW